MKVKQHKILNHFKVFYGLYIFLILITLFGLLISSLCFHEEYLERNREYIVTISGETIYCKSINYNSGDIFRDSKPYLTLKIDEYTYRNVSKSSDYMVQTLITGPQPRYFEWLVGDYDD